MEHEEESEEYLLLAFKEKVDYKFFSKPNLFFKIVNLDTKNPFVQIGNHVFSGKFADDFLGTNLLFEEQDEPRPVDIFDKETQIHLKYIAKTLKVLTLNWYKVPDEIVNIDASEMVELDFRDTYENVIKQLEDGSLDIKDVIKLPKVEHEHDAGAGNENRPGTSQLAKQPRDKTKADRATKEVIVAQVTQKQQQDEIEEEEVKEAHPRYKLLKDLVHKQPHDPEYYETIQDWEMFQNDREFRIFKEVYLKSCKYSTCKKITSKMGEAQLLGQFVDIRASIADGIIANKGRLNESDVERLISWENFDNFSEELKLMVLMDYLREEKVELKKMTQLELAQADEYGRTPKSRYKYVKSFVNDLKYNLFSHGVAKKKKAVNLEPAIK